MKIIFVSNNYTPYSGGVVRSLQALIPKLIEAGHDIRLVTFQFLDDHSDDPVWVYRIPSLYTFQYHGKYAAIPWRSRRYLEDCIDTFKPDIVHIHHPFLLGPVALSIAKLRNIKTIFTHHTIYEEYLQSIPLSPTFLKWPIENMVLRFCKKVDHIIAPSNTIRDRLLKKGGIRNVSVIPSPLRDMFAGLPFHDRVLKRPYQLLSVGRFVPEKNIPFLFKVMHALSQEYELALVGYGPLEYELRNTVSNCSILRDRVRFIVKPSDDELLQAYKSAHLFLFPSYLDTQGIVLAEAMACSLPIIAIDGPGQRDCIVQGKNGFIVSSAQQMAQKICALTHQEKYQLYQKRSYELSQNYASRILIDKYNKVITTLFV